MIPLKSTTQKMVNKPIYGFDIETFGQKNDFYCASLYNPNYRRTFFSIKEFIDEIKGERFKDSMIVATNLQFDFMGTIGKTDELDKMFLRFRGSHLILVKTYIFDGKFYRNKPDKKDKNYNKVRPLTFIDTLNYARLSVEQLGKIINIPKMKKPKFLGKKPKTEEEKRYLIEYNMQDAKVSYEFINFLYESFRVLGATPKITIAGTALSLFKNRFLKDIYFRHDIPVLLNEFKAYYGGRTEAFKRGLIKDCQLYDFNSLYPSVMREEYPNPNTLRINHQNDFSYIGHFDGMSLVDVHCPKSVIIPLLPYRYDNKLLFPQGDFTGWYTNVEIRKARDMGYIIKKIHKNIYFKENCLPFYRYVVELYEERLKYKMMENPMQLVIKIVMNSLYGKFGEKFENRDEWVPLPDTLEELRTYTDFERIGNFLRIKKDMEEPKPYCIPAWCSYVTAYGRIKLYDILRLSNPYYCDTDSVITDMNIPSSSSLGKLKHEMNIKHGIIVKPKFYALIGEDGEEKVKMKGVGKMLNYDNFLEILKDKKVAYIKFMKFKESMRRGFIPNEMIEVLKELSLEDNKRKWENNFSSYELQTSCPLIV